MDGLPADDLIWRYLNSLLNVHIHPPDLVIQNLLDPKLGTLPFLASFGSHPDGHQSLQMTFPKSRTLLLLSHGHVPGSVHLNMRTED